MISTRRPDMRDYFRAQIDRHVYGMAARSIARTPRDVASVHGDITDRDIVVTMRDGTQWHWEGGLYAARKVNGCYAPRAPRPVAP